MYLVKCSIEGIPAKEAQIATTIFQRNITDSEYDSTIVRVNVHNLRKKLNQYYLTDGAKDEIVFHIPTGRYQVEITERKQEGFLPKAKELKTMIFVGVIILTAIISTALSYFAFRPKNQALNSAQLRKSVIWNGFFDNGKRIMFVVGDYYFFTDDNPDFTENLIVRDFLINSDDDFSKMLAKTPGAPKKYGKLGYSYTGHATPFVLNSLLPVFQGTESEICLMSQFDVRYLKQYNIVFFGLYRTMGVFKLYLKQSGFEIDVDYNHISVKKGNKIITTYAQSGSAESFHDDYPVILKFRGPNNNQILLIASFHDTGLIVSASELGSSTHLKGIKQKLSEKYGYVPENFEILSKVVGINRNEMRTDIVQINNLDSAAFFDGNSGLK